MNKLTIKKIKFHFKKEILRVLHWKKEKEKRNALLVGTAAAFRQKRDFQISFLHQMGIKKTDCFLDVGCGVLRGGLPIISYLDSEKYFGVDVNNEALAVAKKEIKKSNLESKKATLFHVNGRLQDITLSKKIDIAFAFSVLFHMTDDHVKDCLQFISQSLHDSGVFYANVNLGSNEDSKWLHFPVKWRSFETYSNWAKFRSKRNENFKILRT
jgi:cyclopropane fatty-acyl-phospholipid synthase-like methyltransferase